MLAAWTSTQVGGLADEPQFSVALGKATVGSALTKPRQHPARFADMAEAG
jgi:hypothetical protein